jgi:hypothetical protein
MGLKEVGWEGVHWIHLVQDKNQLRALVSNVTTLLVQGISWQADSGFISQSVKSAV